MRPQRPLRALRLAISMVNLADLPPLTRDNQWTCRVCGLNWVVARLARDCELRDLT